MFKIPHSKRPAPKHNSKNGLCMENVQKYHFWGDRLDCWFLGVLFSWKFQSNGCFPRWFLLVIQVAKAWIFTVPQVVFDHLSEIYTFSDMFTPSFSGVIYFKNPCTLGGKKRNTHLPAQKP